jgi:hypothetical protein
MAFILLLVLVVVHATHLPGAYTGAEKKVKPLFFFSLEFFPLPWHILGRIPSGSGSAASHFAGKEPRPDKSALRSRPERTIPVSIIVQRNEVAA